MHRFEEHWEKAVGDQKLKIENKNKCDDVHLLKLEMISIKDHLNTLNSSINEIKTKMMFIESNIIIIV